MTKHDVGRLNSETSKGWCVSRLFFRAWDSDTFVRVAVSPLASECAFDPQSAGRSLHGFTWLDHEPLAEPRQNGSAMASTKATNSG